FKEKPCSANLAHCGLNCLHESLHLLSSGRMRIASDCRCGDQTASRWLACGIFLTIHFPRAMLVKWIVRLLMWRPRREEKPEKEAAIQPFFGLLRIISTTNEFVKWAIAKRAAD